MARRLALEAELSPSELSVVRAISRAVDEVSWHISDYTRAVHCWVSGRGPLNYIHFDYCRWAPYESAGTLAALQYLRDKLGFEREVSPAAGLLDLAHDVGWVVAHENICWLSERPTIWSTDINGRLHSATGPALQFRDGWCEHSWKGVSVPQWCIDHPERITVDTVEEQGSYQVRQALIDIMTPAR